MKGSSTAVGSGSLAVVVVASTSGVIEDEVDGLISAEDAGMAASKGTVDLGVSEG